MAGEINNVVGNFFFQDPIPLTVGAFPWDYRKDNSILDTYTYLNTYTLPKLNYTNIRGNISTGSDYKLFYNSYFNVPTIVRADYNFYPEFRKFFI
jgi:hypothetical protein